MDFFDNICILCLVQNKQIKSTLLEDDDGIAIEDKLKYILFEQVNFRPEIPKNICVECLKELNYVYKFKQKCSQNLISLNNHLNKISAKNESHKNNTTVVAECNIEIKDEHLETDHQIQDNIVKDKVVVKSEDACNEKKFDILFFDEIHTKYSEEQVSKKVTEDYNLNCDVSLNSCEENSHISDPNNLDESYIKQEFVNTDELSNELSENGGTFTKINIKDILQTEATNKSDPSVLTGEGTKKLYQCNECQKTFLKKYNFAEHYRTHTGEKPYCCDVCNKAYSHKSSLIIHQRTHSGDRPYQCEICDKAFIRKNHYNYHKLKHTGEKAYKCELCPYKCTTSCGLKSHVRRKHNSSR